MTPAFVTILLAGAVSGIGWWGISRVLGAGDYGFAGSHPSVGALAGLLTGLAVTGLSIPVYRRPSPRYLLWCSPASVYIAIAIYGALLFAFRLGVGDFRNGQTPWAAGVESVMGMWWGVTYLTPVAVTVHLLAYANHRLLRRLVAPTGSAGF